MGTKSASFFVGGYLLVYITFLAMLFGDGCEEADWGAG